MVLLSATLIVRLNGGLSSHCFLFSVSMKRQGAEIRETLTSRVAPLEVYYKMPQTIATDVRIK